MMSVFIATQLLVGVFLSFTPFLATGVSMVIEGMSDSQNLLNGGMRNFSWLDYGIKKTVGLLCNFIVPCIRGTNLLGRGFFSYFSVNGFLGRTLIDIGIEVSKQSASMLTNHYFFSKICSFVSEKFEESVKSTVSNLFEYLLGESISNMPNIFSALKEDLKIKTNKWKVFIQKKIKEKMSKVIDCKWIKKLFGGLKSALGSVKGLYDKKTETKKYSIIKKIYNVYSTIVISGRVLINLSCITKNFFSKGKMIKEIEEEIGLELCKENRFSSIKETEEGSIIKNLEEETVTPKEKKELSEEYTKKRPEKFFADELTDQLMSFLSKEIYNLGMYGSNKGYSAAEKKAIDKRLNEFRKKLREERLLSIFNMKEGFKKEMCKKILSKKELKKYTKEVDILRINNEIKRLEKGFLGAQDVSKISNTIKELLKNVPSSDNKNLKKLKKNGFYIVFKDSKGRKQRHPPGSVGKGKLRIELSYDKNKKHWISKSDQRIHGSGKNDCFLNSIFQELNQKTGSNLEKTNPNIFKDIRSNMMDFKEKNTLLNLSATTQLTKSLKKMNSSVLTKGGHLPARKEEDIKKEVGKNEKEDEHFIESGLNTMEEYENKEKKKIENRKGNNRKNRRYS